MDIVVVIVLVASWRIKRVRRACLTSRFYWCVRSVGEVVKGWRFACNVDTQLSLPACACTYYISDHFNTPKQLLCLCSPHHHPIHNLAPENTILLCFQLNISSEHKYRRAIYKWALCAPLNAILRWTSIETARGIRSCQA